MGKLKEIVIDCDVPSRVARFWAAALDGYKVLPYDDAELARLAAMGLTPETDPTVMVEGPGTRLCFHLRQGERPARNRVHLDMAAADREKEVERLLSLGATFVRETDTYSVLNDPEGNNFCVTSD
ncbi:VOC family protein [Rhizobium bangladeshense]|uniref:VOC family protein n=1 Tax=Rhizobium bangladeshense TaxID=1138189 RepID=UPI001A9971E2|nr:VOC family protein [Rhizobium bangladeshense]MBX4931329.1 VOC family protein [Rhizobium bangladeshense]MBY3582261.1 VOC family protein [Rhizobium bangladeshense]QSY90320.1 VOC family protein [Rhizobium bangladeshense]